MNRDAWYDAHESTPTHRVRCHVDIEVLVAIPPWADEDDEHGLISAAVLDACANINAALDADCEAFVVRAEATGSHSSLEDLP